MAERFEEPSRVRTLRAALPVTVREDLAVELPLVIRWALSLSEGGMVAADLETAGGLRARFRLYERRVRGVVEACADPWPFLLELLELPMGRIVAGGAVELPEEIAEVLHPRPGDRLLLRVWPDLYDWSFLLERDEEGRTVPELYAVASYPLRVEEGDRVVPPEDALRFLPDPSQAFRIPPFLRGCAWVRLSVKISERGAALHWDAWAEWPD